MPAERRVRLLAKLAEDGATLDSPRLCAVTADVVGVSGVGIMIMADDTPQGSICTTNAVSALVEELQYSLREGPCIDAFKERRPVLEPALDAPRTQRWLAFAGPALDAGVRAVFSFPLRIGDVRLGALSLCRDRAGALDDAQHADALAMADIVTRAVLVMQSGAPPGLLAAELGDDTSFHYVVHQASGMVAAQLDGSIAIALVRMRAHAYGNDLSLAQVADEVVARRLRFSASDPTE